MSVCLQQIWADNQAKRLLYETAMAIQINRFYLMITILMDAYSQPKINGFIGF